MQKLLCIKTQGQQHCSLFENNSPYTCLCLLLQTNLDSNNLKEDNLQLLLCEGLIQYSHLHLAELIICTPPNISMWHNNKPKSKNRPTIKNSCPGCRSTVQQPDTVTGSTALGPSLGRRPASIYRCRISPIVALNLKSCYYANLRLVLVQLLQTAVVDISTYPLVSLD